MGGIRIDVERLTACARRCIVLICLLGTFLGITGSNLYAQTTYYSRTSGNWNDVSSWSTVGFGNPTNSGSFPVVGDHVNIGSGHTITVTTAAASASLSFDAGSTIINTLLIQPGIALAVSGTITIPQTIGSGSNILNVGAGTLTAANINFTASGSGAGHALNISTGTVTVNGNITGIGPSSVIEFTGAGLLQVAGSLFTASNGTLISAIGSTVEYTGALAQTIQTLPYRNLVLSGAGVKTLAATTTTVSGDLTIGSGTSFVVPAVTLTVNGATTVDGTLSITSATGTKTFFGLVTVTSNGTWNNTANEAVVFRGGIANSGTFNAGTGVYSFTNNSQALTGVLSIPRVTVTGASVVLTNNNALTINLALAGTGTLAQASGAVLNLGGTSTITGLNAVAPGNTVSYTAAAQTVKGVNYHHLNLSGSGIKTLQAGTTSIAGDFSLSGTVSVAGVTGLTIGGNLTAGAGTTFTAGAFTHEVTGNWTHNGTFTHSGGTITFSGTNQLIGGTSLNFNNIHLSGSGTKTFSNTTVAAGNLSISSGVLASLNSLITHQANALVINGLLQSSTGTWGAVGSGAAHTSSSFTGTGTINILTGGAMYFSRTSGNWNSTSTWSTVGLGGAQASAVPTAADNVIIGAGHTVTITAAATSKSLSFDPGVGVTNTIVINPGITLTVVEDITIPQTTTSGSNILNVGSGALVADNIDFTATPGGAGHEITISTGTATVSGNITGVGATSTVTLTGSGLLRVGGTLFTSSEGTLSAAAGSTVEYNGSLAQTVQSLPYRNLTMSGAGIKTLGGTTTTVNGSLSITTGATFAIPTGLTVAGTTTVDGTLSVTSASGIKTFTGLVTVNGTWSNTANSAVTFQGGITNNGTFTAGTGVQSFTINSQSLNGTFIIPRVTVTGASVTLTNTNSLTVGVALAGTGTFAQGTNAILNLGGTSLITNLGATALGNTVNYTGAAQTIKGVSYHHLGLSGSGIKTLQTGMSTIGGNVTLSGTASVTAVEGFIISGNVSLGSGTSFTAGTFVHEVGGNWTSNGTFAHSEGSIIFNGTAQLLSGSSLNFHNVSLAGSGTKTFSASTNILGYLSISNGVNVSLNGINTHTANTLVLAGALQSATGTWGATGSGAANINDVYFTPSLGTVSVAAGGSTFYARVSGNWNDNSTWSNSGIGGVPSASVPAANDIVVVGGGFTVTVAAAATCKDLLFDTSLPSVLQINTGINLTVVDDVTIPQVVNSGSNTINVGAGSLAATNINFTQTTSGAGHQISVSTGTLSASGNIAGIGAGSVITLTGAGLLQVGGALFTAAEGTLTAVAGSTVEYNGNGAQTIQSHNYSNLLVSGTGSKTIGGTTTSTGGDLTISSGTTLIVPGVTITVGGTTLVNGSLSVTSTTGVKTFTGLVTVNGTWSNTANEAITFLGGLMNSGTFTAGTGIYTFATNPQALGGTVSIPSVTVTGIVLTNNGSLTVNTALSGTGTLTQATGSALALNGTSLLANLNATAAGNTVSYTGGAQTIRGVDYHNLVLSGSGDKTFSSGTSAINGDFVLSGTASTAAVGGLIIGGNVTIGAGTSFTAGAFAHEVGGDWLNNGMFTHGEGTISFVGTNQQLSGPALHFHNVNLAGTGIKTFSNTTIMAGFLAIASGTSANLNGLSSHQASTLSLDGALQPTPGTWGTTGSGAANTNDVFFSGIGTINILAGGTNFYSRSNGDWSNSTTWSNTGFGGAAASSTPSASDNVIIGGSRSVTITSAATCKSLSFDAGAGATNVVSISPGISLTVVEGITIPQTATSGINTLSVGEGSLTASALDFTATSGGAGHRMTISAGTASIAGNITGIGASSTIQVTGAGLLRVGGSMFTSAQGTLTVAAGSTIEYNGTSAQTVQSLGYRNLSLSGIGTKTLAGTSTSISGNLTVGNGVTFVVPATTLAVTGTSIIDGTLSITSTTGTKTFTGAVTVNGTWSNTANEAITFQGGLANNGVFSAGTGAHSFTVNSQALSGILNFASVTITGAAVVVTNNGTLTVNTALSGTGRLTQASGAVLNIAGTSGITNLTATAVGNTVNYTGAAQTIKGVNYHHLGLSGTGVKTLQAGMTTIGGNLTLSGTISCSVVVNLTIGGGLNLGAGTSFIAPNTLSIAGDFTDNGTFSHSNGTVVLNGTSQIIGGSSLTNFHNITTGNSSSVSVESSKNLLNVLSLGTGATFDADGSSNTAQFTLRSLGDLQTQDATIGPLVGGASVTGSVRIERSMSAEANNYRYVSAPVQGVGLSQFTDDMQAIRQSIAWYKEDILNGANRWRTLANDAELLRNGLGYKVWMYNNVPLTWDVTGPINSGDFTWSTANGRLTSTTSTSNTGSDRWNLIGNPYPSSIQWDGINWTIADPNLVATTVYVPDDNNGGLRAFNFVDGSGADGSGTTYALLTDGVIATGQAFWVYVLPGASITLHEGAKVASNQNNGYNFYREKGKSELKQLTLDFSFNGKTDEAYFKLNEQATHNFDVRYDAPKFPHQSFGLYILSRDGERMGMHTIPNLNDIKTVALGYWVEKAGEYTIGTRVKNQFDELEGWYLTDTYTGQRVALGGEEKLTATIGESQLQNTGRFILTKESQESRYLSVHPNPVVDYLFITADQPIVRSELISITGVKALSVENQKPEKSQTIDVSSLTKGIYLVHVQTTEAVIIKKIVKE